MQQIRKDNSNSLGVTATHPLYSLDRQGFVPVEDLHVGERLLSKSGIVTLSEKIYDATPQEVYNLEVGQWHNFLVGVSGVVVHNGPCKWTVIEEFKAGDEAAGVLVNGKYRLNPTATKFSELKINPSGTVKGKTKLDKTVNTYQELNGKEYMYVIDESENLIIGTRAKGTNFSIPDGKAPHPTLIGGENPTVLAAGTIEFRGGKIYRVDNGSGHFQPNESSLDIAKDVFEKKFPSNSFTNDFKGFVKYDQ